MEIRNISQVKVYLLQLNSIFDRCEDTSIVAVSFDVDKLVNWYMDQLCDKYQVNIGGRTYTLSFQAGSVLEHFNPCTSAVLNKTSVWPGCGISSVWINSSEIDQLEHFMNI